MRKMSLFTLITMLACVGVGINCKRTETDTVAQTDPTEVLDTSAVLANGNYLIFVMIRILRSWGKLAQMRL